MCTATMRRISEEYARRYNAGIRTWRLECTRRGKLHLRGGRDLKRIFFHTFLLALNFFFYFFYYIGLTGEVKRSGDPGKNTRTLDHIRQTRSLVGRFVKIERDEQRGTEKKSKRGRDKERLRGSEWKKKKRGEQRRERQYLVSGDGQPDLAINRLYQDDSLLSLFRCSRLSKHKCGVSIQKFRIFFSRSPHLSNAFLLFARTPFSPFSSRLPIFFPRACKSKTRVKK